ncbi:helix-turn-helix transcriptional regulator [Streptacidiphilus sp. N1-10]|uniref:Helix-turn-helix transcriptional regulator n=1 Tax=Streptacidiphilus jeojiensis TaxID=3229225 RepID=A0ABV6XEX1_9ACTN
MARIESPFPAGAPQTLIAFVGLLRLLRADAHLTYRQLSERAHFSVGTLSQAASGKLVPRKEVVLAFVRGCGGSVEEWSERWDDLQRDLQPTAPATAASASEPQVADKQEAPRQNSWQRSRTRMGRKPSPSQESPSERRYVEKTMTELVRSAATSAARSEQLGYGLGKSNVMAPDPVLGALSLCTTAKDFLGMMAEAQKSSGKSLRDISDEANNRFHYGLSKTKLSDILRGTQLPETKTLYVFLRSCRVPRHQIEAWHYHLTRLKIAEIRHAETLNEPPVLEMSLQAIRRSPAAATSLVALLGVAGVLGMLVSVFLSR